MSLIHFTTTRETRVRRVIAIPVTQSTLFTSSGASTRRIAFAAGTVAETINIQQRKRSAHPAKNPAVFPKIRETHANEVPALCSSLFRWINAQAIPNMISPDTRILAGEKTHAIPIIVNAVASIENAGAVPAIPIIRDSTVPREFLRSSVDIRKKYKKTTAKNAVDENLE